jgi:Nucleotidyl transferase AbiEii toxin, Type IV TA system
MTSALHVIARLSRREQTLLSATRATEGTTAMALPDKLGAVVAAASIFREEGAPFALIGGVAVGIRSGVPRATLDVDFAVATSTDRERLAAAFVRNGFRLTGRFAHSTNFVHESGEPVQLAFDPGFDPMIARAEAVPFGPFELPVVTRDDLIAMKRRAAADPKRRRSKALRDEADIALLEEGATGQDEGW